MFHFFFLIWTHLWLMSRCQLPLVQWYEQEVAPNRLLRNVIASECWKPFVVVNTPSSSSILESRQTAVWDGEIDPQEEIRACCQIGLELQPPAAVHLKTEKPYIMEKSDSAVFWVLMWQFQNWKVKSFLFLSGAFLRRWKALPATTIVRGNVRTCWLAGGSSTHTHW